MVGNSWTKFPNGSIFAYGWEKDGEIDFFACQGDLEETKIIKEEIHKFKPDKDYSYSPNSKKADYEIWGELENFTIHNVELKKKIWELTEGDEIISNHKKAMKKHEEAIKRNKEIIKEHEEIRKLHEKIPRAFDDYKQENGKTTGKDPEYVEKYCPNHGFNKVSFTDKYCSGCGSRLGTKNINNFEKENKNQWKWREFCVGIGVALMLFGLVFLLVKLFKKKK